jgi:uncharacterized membrane protein
LTDPRATLLDWLDIGALPRERFGDAMRVAGVAPGAAAWRKFLATLSLWLGAASLAASVVFFVAANWQALGRFAKFGMVEIALVAAIALALWRGLDTLPGKAALVVAALLAGALLALVGQVYQTGADTFELFAAWAVAIVAWVLVARMPALWMLWIAILNLAAIFYFQVVPGRGIWMLFGPRTGFLASFALNALALLAWEYAAARGVAGFAARWAPRVLAFAGGVAITVLAVLAIVEFRDGAGWHLLIYALWLGLLFWAYRVRNVDLLILSGGVLSAIVVVAVALARLLFDRGGSSAVLLMAIVVVAGAGLGAYWLRRVAAEEDAR